MRDYISWLSGSFELGPCLKSYRESYGIVQPGHSDVIVGLRRSVTNVKQ